MKSHRWSKREIEYLHLHASDGAEAIAQALGRSAKSVRTKASRYGISLRRYYVCPKCQQTTTKWLSPVTGWCPTCCIEVSAEKAAEKNRKIRSEIKSEKERMDRARRKRQTIYSDNTRKKCELRELRDKSATSESEEK